MFFVMSRDARPPGPDIYLPDWLIFLRTAQGMLAFLILIFSGVAATKYLLGADPTYLVTLGLLQVIDEEGEEKRWHHHEIPQN